MSKIWGDRGVTLQNAFDKNGKTFFNKWGIDGSFTKGFCVSGSPVGFQKTIKKKEIVHLEEGGKVDLFIFYVKNGITYLSWCDDNFHEHRRVDVSKIGIATFNKRFTSHCKKFIHDILMLDGSIVTRELYFISMPLELDGETLFDGATFINPTYESESYHSRQTWYIYDPLTTRFCYLTGDKEAYYETLPYYPDGNVGFINFSQDRIFYSYTNYVKSYRYIQSESGYELEFVDVVLHHHEGYAAPIDNDGTFDHNADIVSLYSPSNCYRIKNHYWEQTNPGTIDTVPAGYFSSQSTANTAYILLPDFICSAHIWDPVFDEFGDPIPGEQAPTKHRIVKATTEVGTRNNIDPYYLNGVVMKEVDSEVRRVHSGTRTVSSTHEYAERRGYRYWDFTTQAEVDALMSSFASVPDYYEYIGIKDFRVAAFVWGVDDDLAILYPDKYYNRITDDRTWTLYQPYNISGVNITDNGKAQWGDFVPMCVTHLQNDKLLIHSFILREWVEAGDPPVVDHISNCFINKNGIDVSNNVTAQLGIRKEDVLGMLLLPNLKLP